MHEQIRQGNSLLTPFLASATPTPAPAVLDDQPSLERVAPAKKPLDFLLPFAVAANMNRGCLTNENLRLVTESLAERRSALDANDENFYLLDFLIAEARLPFVADAVKPWKYSGWLLPYVILANAARPDVVNRWGWWAACHLEAGLISEPIPHVHFQSEFGRAEMTLSKILTTAWKSQDAGRAAVGRATPILLTGSRGVAA